MRQPAKLIRNKNKPWNYTVLCVRYQHKTIQQPTRLNIIFLRNGVRDYW